MSWLNPPISFWKSAIIAEAYACNDEQISLDQRTIAAGVAVQDGIIFG